MKKTYLAPALLTAGDVMHETLNGIPPGNELAQPVTKRS